MTNEASRPAAVDPLYVEARRVLLDALTALEPHRDAVILAGAQAIYLHTGSADLAVAPYTTDGDLVLDPHLLADTPALETGMTAAGFSLQLQDAGHVEPGIWVAKASVAGAEVMIPIDLIVPETVAPPGGRRAARLAGHGRRSARRASGLEATLVDNSVMAIIALDPSDHRMLPTKVAGAAALLVAKTHKLHDRVASQRAARIDDKDAADVVRLMQSTRADEVASTLTALSHDAVAGPVTTDALIYVDELFGRRGRPGIDMASRALRAALPESQIEALCVDYVAGLHQ